jgi:hypothetical protein
MRNRCVSTFSAVCLVALIATPACEPAAGDVGVQASQAPPDASGQETGTDPDAYGFRAPLSPPSGTGNDILSPTPLVDASFADSFVGCATYSEEAKRIPLDLYFMLDTSGSMADLVGDRQSKWNQVSAAIVDFVRDPASAGLGVGLQYFPVLASGPPGSCTSNAQCGGWGPCVARICDDGTGAPCDSDADCFGASCIPIANCEYDGNTLCQAPGTSCGADANGFALGACQAVVPSCANADSCAEQDYETPAVGIAALPGIADAVALSLASHAPHGATPTPAALKGAIDGARSYASANPGHTVVAVLATDGMPNEVLDPSSPQCAAAPQGSGAGPSPVEKEVAQIAASGLLGVPAVKTFGIGVFTPDDIASGTLTLDQIASAGGTSQPFVIQTDATGPTVEQQFTAALNAIRGIALPCQFQVPTPAPGTSEIANFNAVNVRFTAGSGDVTTIPYVETSIECDPPNGGPTGGWFYDVDPAEGGTPTTIDACPATCSMLQSDQGGRVDVVLGCRTVVTVR